MQPFIEQPQFLIEPKSSYIFENKSVKLECKAIRTRQIFFNCDNKWVPETKHLKSTEINSNGNVIIITSVEIKAEQIESNTYKCYCQAWSATGGTLKSRTATIEIAYLDKIFEWEPLKTDSVISKSTELRCRPPIGNPYPKVTWFKNSQPVQINRNGRFILSNENSLIIAQVKKGDAGNYTCVASNIAGSYSSEPAELIVHDDQGWAEWQPYSECKGLPCTTGRQRRIRTCLNPPTINNKPSCDGDAIQERECLVSCSSDSSLTQTDSDFSEWSSWSECVGIPCEVGTQQRIRNCLKSSLCNNEQTQEQNCFVPCTYSNWTNWSDCHISNCTSVRTRTCLQESCQDNLIEIRSCNENLCSSTPNNTSSLISSSNFNVIVYSSTGIGVLIFLLLPIIFILLYCRHRQRITRKKGLSTCVSSKTICNNCHLEKNDYPFYYSIQQDTTSTRSGLSHQNSLSLTNSDIINEKDKMCYLNELLSNKQNMSTLKFLNQNHLNRIYEDILQTLPDNTDLRYFAVSILNQTGCHLRIPNTGISLTIPEDAVLVDQDHLIFIALINSENHMPLLDNNQTRLSPIILIGPSDITLVKPAVLSFEHTAILESTWKYHILFTENMINWKSILIHGEENISTPVYLQFNQEQQALLLFENVGAYTLVGETILNHDAAKYLQMACFYNQSTLRVRFFDKTSDAYERCLSEEFQMNYYLCDQPKEFILYYNHEQICLNIDYELSSISRINIGYKEMPLTLFSNHRLERTCFIFLIPNLQANNDEINANYLDRFAVHVDVYQPTIVENALHARIFINTRNLHHSAWNTALLSQNKYSKFPEKTLRLPKVIRKKLCEILDTPTATGNDWRMVARNLLGVNYVQYFATKASPTEHLLTLWDAQQQSIVHMINVLNQIGRSDAACIILTHMNITH